MRRGGSSVVYGQRVRRKPIQHHKVRVYAICMLQNIPSRVISLFPYLVCVMKALRRGILKLFY